MLIGKYRIIIALLAATFGVLTLPFVLAIVSPPLHHPLILDQNNPAYQLAASDQAATPTAEQIGRYQQVIMSIQDRCPQLDDILVRVTQTRQALNDQARRMWSTHLAMRHFTATVSESDVESG